MTRNHTDESSGGESVGAGRAVPYLAAVSAAAALAALGLAAWLWHYTYTYVPRPREDISLLGLGYVMAAGIAVPAGLALLASALGWWLGRRGRVGWGVGLTTTALVIMAPLALIGLRVLL